MENKISVIVPVYNAEPYLERCLDSIINNTYRNLEIICIDDGSPDNCGAILDRYAQMDERFVVIHKENGGVSSARNCGLDVAVGDYIAFVDSDDWVHPQYFEIMLAFQNKNPTGFVVCDFSRPKDISEFEAYQISEIRTINLDVDSLWRDREHKACVCGKLYPSRLVAPFRFLENIRYGEDTAFNGMICSANENLQVCRIACPLYFYFDRPGSLVHRVSKEDDMGRVEIFVKLAAESNSDYIKSSFLLDAVKRSLSLRYTYSCAKEWAEVSAYNKILKKNLRDLIQLYHVPVKEKAGLVVFTYVPPLYRLFRIIDDPTLLQMEKNLKAQNKREA